MFHVTYIARELRRRAGRTILTALGLALGVGLVIGIIGVSQGLEDSQAQVLAPLTSVGTDILVTRVIGQTTPTSANGGTATPSSTVTPGPDAPPGPGVNPAPGNGNGNGGGNGGRRNGGGFFGGGGPNAGLNDADQQALLNENRNVVTDLSKLGNPGDQFTRDFFLSATLVSFPADAVAQVAKVPGVASASGGLVQLASHQTGTVPRIVASLQTGGETLTQTVRPEPMTDQERADFRTCLESKGVTVGNGGEGGGPRGGGGFGGPGGRGNPAFEECLPQRFREFQASITTPIRTIEQAVNPPQTDIKSEQYTAAGVDPAHTDQGLVTREQLTEGRWIAPDAKDEILLNTAYANGKGLAVGATVPINGTDYKVVGLVRPTLTGSTADVYFPLATLQALAGKQDRVTQVLVKATDAGQVDAVAAAIRDQLPGAEVVTTKALADQVTGSLADARGLADRLGGALAAVVLAGAFAIAVLLTLASISKRVREIGTLRAIGWSKGRVVRQLLGETVVIGLLGGLLGILVGIGVAASVQRFSPTLTATTTGIPGLAGSRLSGFFGQATSAAQTTTISLGVPLHASTLAIGVAFAVLGGLLAGLVGGWRAARLSPAVALRNLG